MMQYLRTTVTLEPDVDALVKKLMRERGMSFKAAINHGLRVGLRQSGSDRPFETQSRPMGGRLDLTKALQLAGDLEDEEILRKMALRK